MENLIVEREIDIDPNDSGVEALQVSWIDIGEGMDGDYNPEDPDDEALFRLDVMAKRFGEWDWVDDGSICTCTPTETNEATLLKLLEIAMDKIHPYYLKNNGRIKKVMDDLSYMNPDWTLRPELAID